MLRLSCQLSNFCSAVLFVKVLKQTNNLSRTLQNPSISAVQGQEIDHLVIETYQKKSDKKFELFWSNLMNQNTELDVVDPKLPRKRNSPDFYHSQNSNYSFHHD